MWFRPVIFHVKFYFSIITFVKCLLISVYINLEPSYYRTPFYFANVLKKCARICPK